MNKIFILASSLLLAACGSKEERPEVISFRGWDNCIRIANDSAEVIANPAFGGNILYFGLRGGDNVLYSDSTVNGFTIEDHISQGKHPDAGRFDIGNERLTQNMHDTIWAGPYTMEILGNRSVRMTSLPDNEMGIMVERIYTLDAVHPLLTVTQTMKNISTEPKTYCFWTRTFLPAGGTYMTRVEPTGEFPEGFGQVDFTDDTARPYSDTARVKAENGIVAVTPMGQATKLGFQSEAGWSAYARGGVMYVKYHEYCPGELYDNNKGASSFPNMIFMSDKLIEIEPNSPMRTILPGDSYEFTETWQLIPIRPGMTVKELVPVVESQWTEP